MSCFSDGQKVLRCMAQATRARPQHIGFVSPHQQNGPTDQEAEHGVGDLRDRFTSINSGQHHVVRIPAPKPERNGLQSWSCFLKARQALRSWAVASRASSFSYNAESSNCGPCTSSTAITEPAARVQSLITTRSCFHRSKRSYKGLFLDSRCF